MRARTAWFARRKERRAAAATGAAATAFTALANLVGGLTAHGVGTVLLHLVCFASMGGAAIAYGLTGRPVPPAAPVTRVP